MTTDKERILAEMDAMEAEIARLKKNIGQMGVLFGISGVLGTLGLTFFLEPKYYLDYTVIFAVILAIMGYPIRSQAKKISKLEQKIIENAREIGRMSTREISS